MLASILISLLNYLGCSPYLVKIGRSPLTLLLQYADLPNEDAAWTVETLQSCACVFILYVFLQKENNSVGLL